MKKNEVFKLSKAQKHSSLFTIQVLCSYRIYSYKKNIYSSGTSVSLLFNLFSNTPFVIHIKLSFVISNIFACRRQLIMNTAAYRRTSSLTPKKHLVCCFHYVICCTRFCSSCSAYIINLLQPGV